MINLRDAIGVALIAAFIVAVGILFWKAIPEPNEDLIIYMLGQLSGFAGGIVAYHYATNAQNIKATENTGDAFRAIEAAQKSVPQAEPDKPDVEVAPGERVVVEGEEPKPS